MAEGISNNRTKITGLNRIIEEDPGLFIKKGL
jgi:hypothetical protein